jgi:predicted nucleic acid-binding protein
MRTVFVDTAYWIAHSKASDQWHQKAKAVELQLVNVELVHDGISKPTIESLISQTL